jgi:hypothetical protein
MGRAARCPVGSSSSCLRGRPGRTLAGTDPDTAVEEARQALRAFEDLGATHDADRAAAFLRSLGVAGRTGPKLVGELSKRELEVRAAAR